MDLNKHQQFALQLESHPDLQITRQQMRLLHAAVGMATEAGELLDAVKKSIFYGKPIDEANVLEEIGDSQWYHAIGLDAIGKTPADAAETNYKKLSARYGDKFSSEKALERNLDKEREILEEAVNRRNHDV